MRNCEWLAVGALIGAAVIYTITKEKSEQPKIPPMPLPPPFPCGRIDARPKRPVKRDCFYGVYERC